MALAGGPGDPAAPPPGPIGLVFTDFDGDGGDAGTGGDLGAALAGLSFGAGGGGAGPAQASSLPPPTSESMPIAIPGGPTGMRRPGGLGGPGPGVTFIPVDAAAVGASPAHAHGIASSPGGTGGLTAAFADACALNGTPSRLGGHGPLGVPTGASASAGVPPLLAGIDEEDDIDLDFGFGEDDDDLLRALDAGAHGDGPPPPGGSALWAEYGASAPAAPASGFDAFFPPSSVGPSAPARHRATFGFAAASASGASPAALHGHDGGSGGGEGGGMPIPPGAPGGLSRSFAAAGGHAPPHHFVVGSAASDHDAWPFPPGGPGGAGGGGAASMPSGLLSPAHARGGGGGGGAALPPHFHRAPSAPSLAPQWGGGGGGGGGAGGSGHAHAQHAAHYHHAAAARGFAGGTPPVGSAPGVGFAIGSVGTSGAPLSSSLSGSVGRARSGGGFGSGQGRPLSASSPALKHSSSHGALARAAGAASRAGRVSRPPRRPLDDDDGSFESGSYGAAGSGGGGGGGSGSHGGRGTGGGRKHHNPWSVEETEALVAGVEACGGGKWADIKKLGWASMDGRSAVDLKDKWRNLTRLVSLPSALPRAVAHARGVGEPPGEKRRLPPDLLERVRALMPADPDLPYGRITASRAPGARSRARNRR